MFKNTIHVPVAGAGPTNTDIDTAQQKLDELLADEETLAQFRSFFIALSLHGMTTLEKFEIP